MAKLDFRQFQSEILSLYGPGLRSPRTKKKLAHILDSVAALPGVKTTADLTPATVAAFVSTLATLNPNTANGYLGYLRRACNYAVARGYLRASPFAAHNFRLRPRPPADAHLGADQVGAILAHLAGSRATWEEHRLYALIATFAFTGLRRDEGLRLRVADVDLANRVIQVVDRASSPLKTEGSAAPVPIAEVLAEVLAEWLPRSGSPWAFPGITRVGPWTGGPAGKRPLDEAKAAALAAGVAGLTFRGLRQTWATMAESRWGLSELVVQRVLRHARPQTQQLYRKADLPNLTAAVRDLTFPPASPLP
jgi:integrase